MGCFPPQDTGLLIGSIQADQSISFQAMKQKLTSCRRSCRPIPAVDTVVGFTGGRADQFRLRVRLAEAARRAPGFGRQVVNRLRGKLAQVPGARLFLQARRRICAAAGGRATRCTNSRCRRTIRRRSTNGRRA